MSRWIVARTALLFPALLAIPAGMASPPNDASVKLWVDTAPDNPCEQASPASGGWLIRNNEGRNVHIVMHRTTIKAGATTEDQMQDTLGPREIREMGCEASEDGRQMLTVVKATF